MVFVISFIRQRNHEIGTAYRIVSPTGNTVVAVADLAGVSLDFPGTKVLYEYPSWIISQTDPDLEIPQHGCRNRLGSHDRDSEK